ncbi:MAG: hypothetical protein L6R40_008093 [Gallowayella cf. fulva]|nr:MAG: hypothetical protein L6R40_008093 [Xanthomendoza cf. fulva]
MVRYHLLSLPNETITQVIDDLDLTDTWSLAQTSKIIYQLSRPALHRHGVHKNKYSIVRLGPPSINPDGTGFDGSHPLFFLEKILEDPRIAFCVRKLHLLSWSDERNYKCDHFEKEQTQLATTMSTIGTKLAALGGNCPWLSEPLRHAWKEALLVPNNQAHQSALLLTMLPNLQSMTMIGICDYCAPITEMVFAIVDANRDQSSPVHQKALSKLMNITIDHWDSEFDQDIVVFAPFAALPSMRSLHGRMINGDSNESEIAISTLDDNHGRKMQRSQTEEIKMLYSEIDSKSFERILKPVENLKRFTYGHYGALNGDVEYDCFAIMALLRKYACHTLQHIDLTCDMGATRDEQYVGDLKSFRVLRVLRLNAMAFCLNYRVPPKFLRSYVSLIDALPESIQVVSLVGWFTEKGLFDVLDRLEEERYKLPELKRICLEGSFMIPEHHVRACKRVGIEIIESGIEN